MTCLYATEAVGKYAYLGTSEGDLRVFNAERACITTFCLGLSTTGGEGGAAIFAMKLHPSDLSVILIGYEGRPALIWSLKSGKCLHSLQFASPVNTLDWTPDGLEIVTGLRDGNLAFWLYPSKDDQPKRLMRVHSDLGDKNVSAVDVVICGSSGILVCGGQPYAKEGSLAFLQSGESVGVVRIPLPAEPYCVISAPELIDGRVVDRAFVLTEKCGLFSVYLGLGAGKPTYFQTVLGPGRVVKSCFSTVASDGNGVIDFIDGFAPVPDTTLMGGDVIESVTDCFGVLITAHDDELIHFWKVSKLKLVHLASISLLPPDQSPYGNSQNLTYLPPLPGQTVTLLSFHLPHKLILVGDHQGNVTAWKAVVSGFQCLFAAKVTPSAVLKVGFYGGEELQAVFGDMSGNVAVASLVSGEVRQVGSLAEGKRGVRQNVLISDIVTYTELGLAAVGVSNGGVFTVNLGSLEVAGTEVVLNADFVSETPKRSEFGVLKMLPVVSLPNVLIVCYEKMGFAVELPGMRVIAGVSWPVPVFSAAINLFNTNAYLSTLDRTGVLSLWSLPDLVQKWKSETMLPLEYAHTQL